MSWALLLFHEQLFLLSASPSVYANRGLYYALQLTHVQKPAICESELGVCEQVSVSLIGVCLVQEKSQIPNSAD